MSGGYFDYAEHNIERIADSLKEVIEFNGVEKKPEDLSSWDYNKDGTVREDCKYYCNYSKETIEEFKKGYNILLEAMVYAKRIDYLLSGDDGEDDFFERLEKELNNLERM